MAPLRLKICGLTRREDAEAAAELGASYLGTVMVPSSPRFVEPEEARRITEGLEPSRVAVVANLPAAEAADRARRAGSDVIQLHGDETPETVAELRDAGPWRVWKAVRVKGRETLERELPRYLELADGILLDGWHPERLGGTGTPFSWKEARPFLEPLRTRVEVVVAGGLNPENLSRAVSLLAPDTVDVSSGVESAPGMKDPELLRTLFRRARALSEPESASETATP